jgi:hypothetical protein
MGGEALNLKSSTTLLKTLHDALSVRQTPSEILEQRASFVYGSMNSDSNVSRAQIKQALVEQQGDLGKAK